MVKEKYATTELAGWDVAGRKIPQRADGDGNMVPQAGFVLELTPAEAKYPLLSGHIVKLDETGAEKKSRRDTAANA